MKMTKRTRRKAMIWTNMFLGVIVLYAMYLGQETVATTAVAGILTVTTMFIGGDSYRKSDSHAE
jgi:uncharacterized membrane protein